MRQRQLQPHILIKKAIGLESGSAEPHKVKVASITRDQLKTIAEAKMVDLNANDIDMAINIIAGTARSMGVTVESRKNIFGRLRSFEPKGEI